MSATDELRAELTKRGVEWKAPASFDGTARYDTTAGGYWFHEFDGKITIHGLTPAQAIAATLGADASPTQAESSGTLTAEKVRELMEENSRQYPSPTDPYVWLTEYDWQAIADELNATLGSGTCHLKPWEMERDTGFYDSMECDCGYVADVADWASWHFCPSCGRQNVGVDE